VAKDAEGENGGWNIRLIIFVGGTCVSVIVKSFNEPKASNKSKA
jgi:hypothetical protein